MRISDWSSDVCSSDLGGPSLNAVDRHQRDRHIGLRGEMAAQIRLVHRRHRMARHRRVAVDAEHLVATGNREQIAEHDIAAEMRRADHDRHHAARSEEHTSELQSLMRISYAVFCLKKQKSTNTQ